MRNGETTSREEWVDGWKLVLASFVGFSFFALLGSTVSIFIEPLRQEFGWGLALLSSGVAMSAIVTAILSPFIGIFIDRFGSRRIALPGIVATTLIIAAFSLQDGSQIEWLALWVLYATISLTVKATVWTRAVAGVFTAGRGLALAVTMCGLAVAQAVTPPLAAYLIADFGWRAAYATLAFGWGLVTLIACWFLFYDVHDRNAAAVSSESKRTHTPLHLSGLSIAEAWRDFTLWRVAVCSFVMSFLTVALLIHQIPILTESGVSRTHAAWLASMAGISGLVGRLLTGSLQDRTRPNVLAGITIGTAAIAFLFLMDSFHSPFLVFVGMLANGYAAGATLQISSYLTACYGGVRNYGKIYGFMTSAISMGSATGPIIAGHLFDVSRSYQSFLIAGTIGSLVCGAVFYTLPQSRRF